MTFALIFLWIMFFLTHTIYSSKFLYKTILYRPLRFHEVKWILSLLEIFALILIWLFLRGSFGIFLVITATSILTRSMVKKMAYHRALREEAKIQEEGNVMSPEDAREVAESMLKSAIESGRR